MTRHPHPPIPAPETRLPASMYAQMRAWMIRNDPDAAEIVGWSQQTSPPQTAEKMAEEIIWIILCAGRSAQAARTIEAKVWQAMREGKPVVSVFGYRAKAQAIERAWRERAVDFATLQTVLATNDPARLLEWCRSIPFIGDDTQFQLAKNFGAQVPKPDIWWCRVAGIPDRPRRRVEERFAACLALCQMLSAASGDPIAVVDSLVWLACNKGVLQTDAEASPPRLNLTTSRARSIFEAASG